MSSTQRKALGALDPNRLRQLQNTVQHRNRRRPKSKSNGSSEQSSLASYADDSGFDFLSNPDPSSQLLQTSKDLTNSEKLSEATWNSTSKTPKLSNVTAAAHEQALPRSDDISIHVSSVWNQSTATSANVATVDSTSNIDKGSNRNKVKEAKKPVQREGITAEISSAFEKWKKFRQRSKHNPENEYLSISSSINNGHSFLETITEGTVEQENSSPIQAKNADDPTSYALSESRVTVMDNDMSIKNRGTDAFRLDNTKDPQFKETSPIHDHLTIAENGENSDMDIDESPDDESTDLTICPIDSSQTEIIPDIKEIPNLGKNNLRRGGEFESSTDGKPTNVDIQNISEEYINATVSQPIAFQAEDSAILGLPHHHTRKSQDNPSKRVKYLQVVDPLHPRTAPIDYLVELVPKKVRSPDACLLPIVDNKPSTFIEAEKGGSVEKQHPVPQNVINNVLFATTNLTAIAQNEAKKKINEDSENKHSTKNENQCHSPIDKEVWNAVMGTCDTKPESELIGLIIETPARTSSIALEIESTVGSELTNDSSLSIGSVRGNVASAKRGLNSSFHPENQKKPSTQKKTSNPHSVFKSASYHQDTLQTVKSSSVNSTTERMPSKRQHIHVTPKISSGKLVSSHITTSRTDDDERERDEFAVDNGVKARLQTPDRGSVSLLLVQTPSSEVMVQSHEPSNRQNLEILNRHLRASCKNATGPRTFKPFPWTAETAGRKFNEFGVNAAPVFRLTDGVYYQHPPLPPGWTIAVSRSLNIPYYIHPDWGTTFYSPVPLPSNDGTIVGTTLLYQADTPRYCPPEDYTSKPHADATPNVLTAPGLPSIRWSDDTSTVLSKNFEKARINTPLGALVVASTTLFSESQNGIISNSALQHQMIGLTPLTISKENGDLESVAFNFESPCNSSNSNGSTDSSTTVTIISNKQHDVQTTIPREIEIKRNLDDDMNIDRFKFDLKNANKNLNSAPSIPISAHSRISKTTASRDVELVISPRAETDENRVSETGIVACSNESSPKCYQEGNATSEKQALLSEAMSDSDDSSLDWTVAISEGSCNSKKSNCKTSQPPNQGSSDQVACEVGSNSDDLRQESMVIFDDDHSPYDSSAPADHTDTVPRKIAFALNLQSDDMSMLQSPQTNKSKLRHFVEPSTLIVDGGEDMYIQDDDGFVSMNSTSFVSGRSSKSRASIRSLYPKLPLCSLQNLPEDFEKSKKRKESTRKKPAKRKLSSQIVPISA